MKIKLIRLTFLLLVLPLVTFGQTNSWNSLVPLVSTRADVEKIIGKPEPDSKSKYFVDYKTKNESVFVLYSTGNCDLTGTGWNIEDGKVIRISVEPFVKLKLDEYKFDKSKYKEYEEDHLDMISYANDEDGVAFTVNKPTGEIVEFRYHPKSKDYFLMCKRP
jgi:hypothetical protein